MLIRFILVYAIVLIGVMSARAADPSFPIAGKWITDWGLTELTESGGKVTGGFPFENGKIIGIRSENRLTGHWTQTKSARRCETAVDGNYFHGRLVVDIATDDFVGRWGYCDDTPVDRYSGKRVSDRPISGKWNTDWGLTDLTESGGKVTGSFPFENGKIVGIRSESRLTAQWTQTKSARRCETAVDGNYFHGRMVVDLAADEFIGTWGYCDDSPTEKWSGRRSLDGKELPPGVASLPPADREARVNSLIELARRFSYGSPESNAAWSEAAALGNIYARGLLANRFCQGEFVQKDERRCHSIYLLLAEEGHAQSQEMVGRQYMYGQGTAKDIQAARYWFERAANQGNSAAMGLLGNLYDPMENHFPNMDLAIFWKRMAYKRGNDNSYYWLKQRNLLERAQDEKAFITRIDTQGPDRSNLSNFNYEVAVYCQYGGKQCNALRSEGYQLEKKHNASADAANMQRLWSVYRRESADPAIRTKCLQRATETLHKATYGQQSWYYSADNC